MKSNHRRNNLNFLSIALLVGVFSANVSAQVQPGTGLAMRAGNKASVPASRFRVKNYMTDPVPYAITAGDFNGDGSLDIVTADPGNFDFGQSNNTVGVLLNRGDGTFAPNARYQVGGAPTSVAVGDFNGTKNSISHRGISTTAR